MRVPETPVDEYHFAPCGKCKVRLARKIGPVQTESVAKPVYEAAHLYLRLRVLAPDCSHILAAIHASSLLEFLKEPI